MPNFTTEDLLTYLYNEMEPRQAQQLESALQSDWMLQQKCSVLAEAQQTLNTAPLSSPRLSTISSILQYAESTLHLSN